MVGERGKELFVPNHSGKIVPHGRTMGMENSGGGSGGEFILKGRNLVLSGERSSRYSKKYGDKLCN